MSMSMPSPRAGIVPEWSLADRLRKAREHAGLEQTELARITGISRATISAAENGHKRPMRANVRLWAMATGVPLEWVETGKAPSEDEADSGVVRPEGFEPPTFCSVVERDVVQLEDWRLRAVEVSA